MTAAATAPSRAYLDTLTRYYEEEIEGEAWFAALAERLSDPQARHKARLLAEVETRAAASVAPLLEKYRLGPRPAGELREAGRAQAARETADWPELVERWRRSFPAYIDDFERLEAMAPPEDLPLLKRLTAHEIAAIAFLEAEASGAPDSAAPLRRYLETGRA